MTDSPKESQAMRKAMELAKSFAYGCGCCSYGNQEDDIKAVAAALTEARAQALEEAASAVNIRGHELTQDEVSLTREFTARGFFEAAEFIRSLGRGAGGETK